MTTRVCVECGKRFEGRSDSRYCEAACRQRAYRERTGDGEPMTSRERSDLMTLVRKRERVALKEVDVRAAELMAEFEHQMASIYDWNDQEVWAEAMAAAKEAAAEADAKVAERCRELGIPDEFRGGVTAHWSCRGQNALSFRQTELRRVARTKIDALSKTAKHEVQKRAVDAQEALTASGLKSGQAQAFLASMPTPEELMPTLNVGEVERALTEPKMGPRPTYLQDVQDSYLLDEEGYPDYGSQVDLLPAGDSDEE
jgi:hypothetical protein